LKTGRDKTDPRWLSGRFLRFITMIFKNSKDLILVYIGLITVLKKIGKKSDHEMTSSLALL
jgi:hypothetical protein